MNTLKKISKGYDRFLEFWFYIPALMILGLLVICALMVCLRKVLVGAFNWADEAMRFLMVYATFVALPLLVSGKRNITIDMTDIIFPHSKKGRWVFHLIAEVLTLVCCVALMPSILLFMQKTVTGLSPAMQIPMWVVYSCLPIGFGLSILSSLNNLIKLFTEKEEG